MEVALRSVSSAEKQRHLEANGYGTQVRSFRQDALDSSALDFVASMCRPIAVDLGCGKGEQAIAMALAGAQVAAVDHGAFAAEIRRRTIACGMSVGAIQFWRRDVSHSRQLLRYGLPVPEVLYCQRMLHYLPYMVAREVLIGFREKMRPRSRLYLGLSGLLSELGRGYSHGRRPVVRRLATLAPAVAAAHRITMPVCLYSLDDACQLVEGADFSILSAETSSFGNHKLVAEVP